MPEKIPPYLPIEDYGVIGDLRTVALVGRSGSIDWFCAPRFDSASIFAALLDQRLGGRFRIAPVGAGIGDQHYIERTNVLRTTWKAERGRLSVTDWMPLEGSLEGVGKSLSRDEICRMVDAVDGPVGIEVEWSPRFDYGRAMTELTRAGDGAVARGGGMELTLVGLGDREDVRIVDDGVGPTLRWRTTVEPGHPLHLVLRWGPAGPHLEPAEAGASLIQTVETWQGWVDRGQAAGPADWAGEWQDLVTRSALALKLLIHDGSGGIVAAPTTSLPEDIGGGRNWDYRYSWVRDAAQTADALFGIGHPADAVAYVRWLERTARIAGDRKLDMKLMYTLDGEYDIPESELSHLEGYRGSRPVRIGNAAASQRQLDIFGELIQAAYEMVREGHPIGDGIPAFLTELADVACAKWHHPDHGIWEARKPMRHYVHSKVMVWVCLDRAGLLARDHGLQGDADRWAATAQQVREVVLDRGFDQDLGAFVWSFGSNDLDAANLLIPIHEFLPADDPRVQGTINRTIERLTENGLVYRYRADDGLDGEEGAFGLCTFWLVDALVLSGRLDEASEIFGGMAARANHLGLYSEEIDPSTGAFLGNFPQAFTHIGLINSAMYLADAEGREIPLPSLIGTARHRKHADRDR